MVQLMKAKEKERKQKEKEEKEASILYSGYDGSAYEMMRLKEEQKELEAKRKEREREKKEKEREAEKRRNSKNVPSAYSLDSFKKEEEKKKNTKKKGNNYVSSDLQKTKVFDPYGEFTSPPPAATERNDTVQKESNVRGIYSLVALPPSTRLKNWTATQREGISTAYGSFRKCWEWIGKLLDFGAVSLEFPAWKFGNLHQNPIGGEGKVVEIDEAVWRRRKYKRGRRKEQIWIFGGVERLERGGAGPRFVKVVPNRKRETLLPIILETIRSGTTIMSDEWKAYPTLDQYNYTHKTYKAVEKPAEVLAEEEVEDEDSEITQIEDILGDEETEEESSGLETEEEKTSDYEP
ncbi:putative ISXO2-like transposase domain [Monocercomonoides exilis]|uniref:putative ISXO2-like transposase domain n=1 Tax=Monocercomonoides exilis TaxID=2049356 RepID=UPI00355AB16A|nr:putative ISXO2-like transposase domain [Monocercomonoides exilis]|eukprot:MONOS_12373.1-p1 / transcript=MONOS_12373.1 / gene=MONOS_12373 / organism=Monocercomonoides_exilis_PA203 / gene_product=unspecified product / transcript_product=unspecified product / location=Mono_scaffold00680:31890-34629(+) / protein_length=348 / sequence_SO=supercontig / SO=protein_coding / is_pseudo=false